MSLEEAVRDLLNDPKVIEYLKDNDLDSVYNYYDIHLGIEYDYYMVCEELGILLADAQIDVLKYIKSLSWFKMGHIPFSQPIDLSQYTNIKKIADFGFTDCRFSNNFILPSSIISINTEAFTGVSIKEGCSLQVSTKSLKEVDIHAFAIDNGCIKIDDNMFYQNEWNKIEEYLNSKGITTYR